MFTLLLSANDNLDAVFKTLAVFVGANLRHLAQSGAYLPAGILLLGL